METLYPISINIALSIASALFVYKLVPAFKELFRKAGLKRGFKEHEIPESLGIVCATLYLICMFLFIPVPFVSQWIRHHGNIDSRGMFPHKELVEFITGLLSICCMILLGFAADVLDLQWHIKMALPCVASSPLLMVYIVNGGVTNVTVPVILQQWLGFKFFELGILYYMFMYTLAVFCTKSINMLSGINGLEIGQSAIIGFSVLLFNAIEMRSENWKSHLFSIYFLIPYLMTSLALYKRVLIGQTRSGGGKIFCYFSGMTFSVVAIFGHFSKTMMLFFIPQFVNSFLSLPQFVGLIPCPNCRLPILDDATQTLEPSKVLLDLKKCGFIRRVIIYLLRMLRLIHVENIVDKEHELRIDNTTLMNIVLRCLGPIKERDLMHRLLLFQIFANAVGFCVRYGGTCIFYGF